MRPLFLNNKLISRYDPNIVNDVSEMKELLKGILTEILYSKSVNKTMETGFNIYHAANRVINDIKKQKAEDQHLNDLFTGQKEGGRASVKTAADKYKTKIVVYDKKGEIIYSYGDKYEGKAIELTYHEADTNNHLPAHYTPKGESRDWRSPDSNGNTNSCLFEAIAHQLDKDPLQTKAEIIDHMKSDREKYIFDIHNNPYMGNYSKRGGGINNAMMKIKNIKNLEDKKIFLKNYLQKLKLKANLDQELVSNLEKAILNSNNTAELNNSFIMYYLANHLANDQVEKFFQGAQIELPLEAFNKLIKLSDLKQIGESQKTKIIQSIIPGLQDAIDRIDSETPHANKESLAEIREVYLSQISYFKQKLKNNTLEIGAPIINNSEIKMHQFDDKVFVQCTPYQYWYDSKLELLPELQISSSKFSLSYDFFNNKLQSAYSIYQKGGVSVGINDELTAGVEYSMPLPYNFNASLSANIDNKKDVIYNANISWGTGGKYNPARGNIASAKTTAKDIKNIGKAIYHNSFSDFKSAKEIILTPNRDFSPDREPQLYQEKINNNEFNQDNFD